MKTFRLIGNTTEFNVTGYKSILMGTVTVVYGVSTCGKFRTGARVEDVVKQS